MRTNVNRARLAPPQLFKTPITRSLSIEAVRKMKVETVILTRGINPSAWGTYAVVVALPMIAPSANAIRVVVEFRRKVYVEVGVCFSTTLPNAAFRAT